MLRELANQLISTSCINQASEQTSRQSTLLKHKVGYPLNNQSVSKSSELNRYKLIIFS